VLQKNQIRPVNEAGRAEGFFPVTSCNLGKRQPEGELRFTPPGCLFAGGRILRRGSSLRGPWREVIRNLPGATRVLTVPSALSIFTLLSLHELPSLLA
jgi:hypothetical protein